MRKHFAQVSEKAWNELLAEHKENTLERMFPTPDFSEYILEDMQGKIVVLDSVRYPDNQFMGTGGEFVWTGTRSDGMYFVKIDSRKWLGPYEAVKLSAPVMAWEVELIALYVRGMSWLFMTRVVSIPESLLMRIR